MHEHASHAHGIRHNLPRGLLLNQDMYRAAVEAHRAGDLFKAERGYRDILSRDANHADSLHMLGVLGHQTGHNQAAETMIRKAIALNGRSPDYYCNLGSALQALGRQEEAVASYQSALHLAPDHAVAQNNLGNALLALGRTQEAIGHYARALTLCPQDADARNNMGSALLAVGKPSEAKKSFEKSLALDSKNPQTCFNLGCACQELGELECAVDFYQRALSLQPDYATAHNNLGNVFQAQEKSEEAIASYRRAIALKPDDAKAYNNLGNVLRDEDQPEEALECYGRALTLKPDYLDAVVNAADTLQNMGRLQEAVHLYEQILGAVPANARVHRNLGDALRKSGDLTAAAEHCQQAITLAPEDADAHLNLGNVFFDTEQTSAAIVCYQRAIALRPAHAISHLNLAAAELKRGNFSVGWKEYEGRKRLKAGTEYRRNFSEPEWQGEPLCGRRILLYCEQGLGDSLQFLRYVPLVRAAGGRVVLEVPPRLQRLAAQMADVEELTVHGSPLPAFDLHCPLMSLPLALGTDSDSIPAAVPYLHIPEDARLKAQEYAWPADGLRVGISWAGNAKNPNDKFRSIPFDRFLPFFDGKGVNFFSLQIGDAVEQMKQAQAPVVDLAPLTADMADTAAFLAHLDLVITIDTSIAHLAGALAKPVWILLPANADWRWMEGREDSPWYPTARLFRQRELDNWKDPLERVAACLRSFLPPPR